MAKELGEHAPFTILGAVSGIIIVVIVVLGNVLPQITRISPAIFYVLHPTHVVLSALVTTALYKKYSHGKVWAAILVGYFGSIGIATLSDSVIPYLGEALLDLPPCGRLHRSRHPELLDPVVPAVDHVDAVI